MCEFVFQLNSYAQISLNSSTHNFSSFFAFPLSPPPAPTQRSTSAGERAHLSVKYKTKRASYVLCAVCYVRKYSLIAAGAREKISTHSDAKAIFFLGKWKLIPQTWAGDRWSVCAVGGLEYGFNLKLFACRTSFVESSFWDAREWEPLSDFVVFFVSHLLSVMFSFWIPLNFRVKSPTVDGWRRWTPFSLATHKKISLANFSLLLNIVFFFSFAFLL